MDADTGNAVPGASVEDTDRPGKHVETGRRGRFRLAPQYQWHAGVMIGIAANHPVCPLPSLIPPQRGVQISAQGYATRTIYVGGIAPISTGEKPEHIRKGAYYVLDPLILERLEGGKDLSEPKDQAPTCVPER